MSDKTWELLTEAGPYRNLKKAVDPLMIKTIIETSGNNEAVRIKDLEGRSPAAVLSQIRKILAADGHKLRSRQPEEGVLVVWVD